MSRKDYLGHLILLVLHTGVAGAANIPAQTQSLSSASSSSSGFGAVATGIRVEEQTQAVDESKPPGDIIALYVFIFLIPLTGILLVLRCCYKGLSKE